MIERTTNGNFYGYVVEAKEDGVVHEQDLHKVLKRMLARSNGLSEQANELQKGPIGAINYQL